MFILTQNNHKKSTCLLGTLRELHDVLFGISKAIKLLLHLRFDVCSVANKSISEYNMNETNWNEIIIFGRIFSALRIIISSIQFIFVVVRWSFPCSSILKYEGTFSALTRVQWSQFKSSEISNIHLSLRKNIFSCHNFPHTSRAHNKWSNSKFILQTQKCWIAIIWMQIGIFLLKFFLH